MAEDCRTSLNESAGKSVQFSDVPRRRASLHVEGVRRWYSPGPKIAAQPDNILVGIVEGFTRNTTGFANSTVFQENLVCPKTMPRGKCTLMSIRF